MRTTLQAQSRSSNPPLTLRPMGINNCWFESLSSGVVCYAALLSQRLIFVPLSQDLVISPMILAHLCCPQHPYPLLLCYYMLLLIP